MNDPRSLPRETLESRLRLYRRLTIVLAIVAAFLLVVAIGQLTLSPSTGTASDDDAKTTSQDADPAYADSPVVRRDADDPMAFGDVDAPVVLTMWTDLRCPFCAAFHRDTLPALMDEYVETGEVRIEVIDVAFFGEQSEDAAVAASAAGDQGAFGDFTRAVYEAAPASGHPDLPTETLIAFAEEAGVTDIDRFTAALADEERRAATVSDTQEAQSLGVNAVPFFRAGDVVLSGAHPVDTFRAYLDQAVAQAR